MRAVCDKALPKWNLEYTVWNLQIPHNFKFEIRTFPSRYDCGDAMPSSPHVAPD
jgi:hypothetical protein